MCINLESLPVVSGRSPKPRVQQINMVVHSKQSSTFSPLNEFNTSVYIRKCLL